MNAKTFWDNWLPAWAISRQIPLPQVIKHGYLFEIHKDGNIEKEVLIYSLNAMAEVQAELANADYFCISELQESFTVPNGWEHRSFSFMMANDNLQPQAVDLAEKFTIFTEPSENRFIAYHNSYAVFDLIETNENYRRQGLATQVMNLLTNNAVEKGITTGLLCASNAGKPLYEALGWQVIGQYSRMVKAA